MTDNGEKKNRRPSAGPGSEFALLRTLNTYTPRFTVKARVVDKGQLTTFNNKRTNRPGSVFNCTLIDVEGTQINAKFWNAVADANYEIIEKGSVYILSKGKVSVANKRYSNGVDHNFELTFDSTEVTITPATEDEASDVPLTRQVKYASLRSIELNSRKLPFMVNLVAVVHSVQPTREVTLKTQDTISVRTVHVVDATEYEFEISFWGPHATDVVLNVGEAVELVNVQVREGRGGRVGSTIRSTDIEIHPTCPEALELKKWYDENANTISFKSMNGSVTEIGQQSRTISEVTLAELQEKITAGIEEESQVYRVNAFVDKILYRNIRTDNSISLCYEACNSCNKKFDENGCCPSCNGTVGSSRISTTVSLTDHTASGILVRVFSDVAQVILGRNPPSVKKLVDENNELEIQDLCDYQAVWKRYTFTIRARREMFRSELRTNLSISSVQSLAPNNFAALWLKRLTDNHPGIFDSASNKRTVHSESFNGNMKRLKVEN